MYTKVMIVSINGTQIKAMQCSGEACSACSAGCDKKNKAFTVVNPQNLPIQTGSIVRIEISKARQVFEGLCTLFVPFLCAVCGYFLAGTVAKDMGSDARDGLQAIAVLVFLMLSAAAVFFLTRTFKLSGKLEIKEIIG